MALQARLASLRGARDPGLAPTRLLALEALARRAATQPERVRRLLLAKLRAALDAASFAQAEAPATSASPRPRAAAPCTPLADLNAHIRRVAAASAPQAGDGMAPELASVQRFRRAWSAVQVEDQLDAAVARKPANAGPLNSHALVLESLALLRELSPAYLGRFMAQVEALQWLEQAAVKPARAKPAKRPPRPAAAPE